MDANTIADAVTSVTKEYTRQRKREERAARARSRRREALTRSERWTLKDAAADAIPDAYHKASGIHGVADARQVMYAARPEIQDETGRPLDDQYFCQKLLPRFMMEHPKLTAGWDVVFDARGHFHEPHTRTEVALGTLDARGHLNKISDHKVGDIAALADDLRDDLDTGYPTKGPQHRYAAVLFIEKEGFWPLLKAAKIAERYDLAIMSTKGMSVTAARSLVDRLCGEHGIPLLVLHDFDKAGFSILGTFQRDTERYKFRNTIKVIDLGLRLSDVTEYGLQSEFVSYKREKHPERNLRKNGATEDEIAFLVEARSWRGSSGRRVELNAFTNDQFIEWLEGKLDKVGIKKVIPKRDILRDAYRRAAVTQIVKKQLDDLVDDAIKQGKSGARIPRNLTSRVREALEDDPSKPWDQAVAEIVAQEIGGDD